MYINIIRLEKEGILEKTKIVINDVQKVVDVILESFIKTDGRFPTYAQVQKSLKKQYGTPLSKFRILITFLIANQIIESGDKHTQVRNEYMEMKLNFKSVYISMTQAEAEEVERLLDYIHKNQSGQAIIGAEELTL